MKKVISPISMISPAVLWLVMFIVIPIGFIFFISFMTKNVYGGYIHKLDLTVYLRFFNNRYLRIFGYSALIALATTIISLLIGYPFAYIISTSSKRIRNLLLMAIMLPFWINSLIRTSGWITILRLEGVANTILQRLNIIQEPLKLLYNDGAVLFGMVYILFPFMVLPLYSSLEKLDPALLEASSDLGARPHELSLGSITTDIARSICRLNSSICTVTWIFLHCRYYGWRQDYFNRQLNQKPIHYRA